MSSRDQTAEVRVPANGWRFYPWGWRITSGTLFAMGLVYTYELLGPSGNLTTFAWLVLTALVVAGSIWISFELQSQRQLVILSSGVTFCYPGRSPFVPWERLRFSSRQPPQWYGTVLFLEIDRKSGLRQLAHHVTRNQAKAILEHTPSAPTDPQAKLLLEPKPARASTST